MFEENGRTEYTKGTRLLPVRKKIEDSNYKTLDITITLFFNERKLLIVKSVLT